MIGRIMWVVIISVFIISFGLVILFIIIQVMNSLLIDKDCLKEIAKEVCEDKEMIYERILTYTFWCKENEREIGYKTFLFIEEEIKGCKK